MVTGMASFPGSAKAYGCTAAQEPERQRPRRRRGGHGLEVVGVVQRRLLSLADRGVGGLAASRRSASTTSPRSMSFTIVLGVGLLGGGGAGDHGGPGVNCASVTVIAGRSCRH